MAVEKKWSYRGYDIVMRKHGSHYVAVISRGGSFVDQMTSVGPEDRAVDQFKRFIDAVTAGPSIGDGDRVRIVGSKYPHLTGKTGVVTPIRGAVYGGSYGYPVTIDGQFYTVDSDSVERAGSAESQESATMRSMHAASEYAAVNSSGRRIAGPFRDYGEAKLHADRAGGYVVFVSDLGANDCVGVHTHGQPGPAVIVAGEIDPAGGYALAQRMVAFYVSQNGLGTYDPNSALPTGQPAPDGSGLWSFYVRNNGQYERRVVSDKELRATYAQHGANEAGEDAKFERCVQHVKASGSAVNPWAVCHAQLGEASEVHRCTAESASAIAQQIPGGPWQHEGTYPAGAQARVDHEKEHSVTIDGKAQTIRVRYCGSHLILRCPTSGEQHLFKKTCIADVPVGKPQRGRVPAAPGVDAEPGKRFVLRVRKGRSTVSEFGPFKQITEAVDKMNELGQPGETATIYDGAKIAMYRGGRAIFSFGRTRWSRA